MKKVFAIFLALTMVCSSMAIAVLADPPVAEATNIELTIEYLGEGKDAPVVDGEIELGEYGSSLISWSLANHDPDEDNDGINTGCYKLENDPDLAIDFYATFDDDYLYMAWNVSTRYDSRFKTSAEEPTDGYMYNYCYMQIMITPGAPDNTVKKFQTDQWAGNYLDLGFCLEDDGRTYQCVWSSPAEANGQFKNDSWLASVQRYDDEELTVYECRIPLAKTGMPQKGDGAQFGLSWGVGVQEHYGNIGNGIIEYADALIGGKNADNACIVTLSGGQSGNVESDFAPTQNQCPAGALPAGLKAGQFELTMVNGQMETDAVNLAQPNTYTGLNAAYSSVAVLTPAEVADGGLEGWYTVSEIVKNTGSLNAFANEPADDALLLVVHGDEGVGADRKALLEGLEIGTRMYVFGVQTWKDGTLAFKYNNAQVCLAKNPAEELIGTWKSASGKKVTFNDDKTGSIDGTAIAWELANGVLKIDGAEKTFSLSDDCAQLTLDGETYDKLSAGNYANLDNQIRAAKLRKEADYTAESYKAMTDALAKAEEVKAAAYMSDEQGKIDEAADALKAAIDGLVKVSGSDPAGNESSATSDSAVSGNTSTPADDSGSSTGVIVLIIVLAVVVVAGVVVAIVVVGKKKKA